MARPIEAIIEELHPAQQAGLEIAGEPVDSSYDPSSSAVEQAALAHMREAEVSRANKVVTFVAEDDPTEMWSLGDDRLVGGADITYDKSAVEAMQAGMVCIRCGEFQEDSFPLACELCGYPMRDRQIRDLALEFLGSKHLGPSKPIQDYQDELEERALKARFERKIAQGASPMKGLRH